jgi:hypothetical protein
MPPIPLAKLLGASLGQRRLIGKSACGEDLVWRCANPIRQVGRIEEGLVASLAVDESRDVDAAELDRGALCPEYGLVFQREEGYFLGSMYVSYVLSSLILITSFVAGHLLLADWNPHLVLVLVFGG